MHAHKSTFRAFLAFHYAICPHEFIFHFSSLIKYIGKPIGKGKMMSVSLWSKLFATIFLINIREREKKKKTDTVFFKNILKNHKSNNC